MDELPHRLLHHGEVREDSLLEAVQSSPNQVCYILAAWRADITRQTGDKGDLSTWDSLEQGQQVPEQCIDLLLCCHPQFTIYMVLTVRIGLDRQRHCSVLLETEKRVVVQCLNNQGVRLRVQAANGGD